MSRCFPFPPPGYEKKLNVEDVSLLAKGKNKERRHKKEKDEYKKEGGEKDKERSKEGRKEKDKEKHKHKDRSKKRSRYEKSFESGRPNVEKLGSSSPQSSCLQELERRPSSVDGTTRSQTVHSVSCKSNDADWTESKGGVVDNTISKSTEAKQMQIHHNGIKRAEKSKDKNAKRHKGEAEICTPRMFGYDGVPVDPSKDAAVVRELERRVLDENGATGSQVGLNTNVTIQKRAQNPGNMANGYTISISQTKGNSKSENGSNSMVNGQKDNNNQSRVPKVATVHNIKVEKRECEAKGAMVMSKKAVVQGIERNRYSDKGAVEEREIILSRAEACNKTIQRCEEVGTVGMSKKAAVERIERNEYCGKGVVDTRKKNLFKDEDRDKPREEWKLKDKAYNTAELSTYGHNGSDSTVSNGKHFSLEMSNQSAETVSGKRKEPEANGSLHDNETRPRKWQKTVVSSRPATENERQLKSSTTINLTASKLEPANGYKRDDEEHERNRTVTAQSSPVPTNPELSVAEVPRNTGSQKSSLINTKSPMIGQYVSGTIGAHGSPITAEIPSHMQKVHDGRETVKSPLTAGNVNGVISAHATLKPPPSPRKEKRKGKSSSKPLPPHPDTKYLSHILSVPKMEDPSEFDDTEWLFESNRSSSKQGDCSNVGYVRDGEHVWAKGVHFDFADVYALPFVVPY